MKAWEEAGRSGTRLEEVILFSLSFGLVWFGWVGLDWPGELWLWEGFSGCLVAWKGGVRWVRVMWLGGCGCLAVWLIRSGLHVLKFLGGGRRSGALSFFRGWRGRMSGGMAGGVCRGSG